MMNKILLIIGLVFFLGGCSAIEKLDIFSKPAPVTVIHPPLPEQLSLRSVPIRNLNHEIMIDMLTVTEEEKAILMKNFEDGTLDPLNYVFVTISPEGYENLSLNLQELKRIIQHQKSIIIYYRTVLDELSNDEEVDSR